MSPTVTAVACATIGLIALVAGCAMVAPWLALVVGGIALIAVAAAIDEPPRKEKHE